VRFGRVQRFDLVLAGIAVLSAFLNIFNIWQDQYANVYYTTAVASMLQSWHNFFFASLDPAGYITIDKPPVAFWVQTLFAHVFGVHGWSVILPQALAGVGSVLLVYCLVRPTFGRAAARLASLVMACTPIAVAVSRTNNIDSLLVFTLLLGTWMLFRAVATGKAWWVLGAFAMIGVGFNMKMFQAYMVAPAFYLFYLLAFKSGWGKKLAVLAAATVGLAGVTLSWAVIVDAIPPANRPYIGGSQTNSVLELALGYNGIQRLTGMGGGPGGAPGGGPGGAQGRFPADGSSIYPGTQPAQETGERVDSDARADGTAVAGTAPGGNYASGIVAPGQAPGPGGGGQNRPLPSGGGSPRGQVPPSGGGQDPGPGDGSFQGRARGGGSFGTGSPGPLRLFQSELSGQASWLLPLVGFAGIALLAGICRWLPGARPLLRVYSMPAPAPLAGKPAEALFWLGWLLPGMMFFSMAGFYHHYYLIMLAPPIAALTGAGWVELWSRYRDRDGWRMWLLPTALLATTVFELYVLQPYQGQIGRGWSIGVGAAGVTIALALVLLGAGRMARLPATRSAAALALAGMLVLLAAPAYWSATPILYGNNSSLPQAGPGDRISLGRGSGGASGQAPTGGRGEGNSNISDTLIAYVTRNNTGEPCLFATTDTGLAESYILAGQPVIALSGFNSGGNNTLTKLEQMVSDGKIRFFLIPSGGGSGGGGRGPGGGGNDIGSWIREHCTEVPAEEWQTGSAQSGQAGVGNAGMLYKVNDSIVQSLESESE
jgi:4-amino-4-deoxy-L-arabinose transferase-like glycosyltransferase